MKLSINEQSVMALREYADKIPEIGQHFGSPVQILRRGKRSAPDRVSGSKPL